ncbi:outer membrane lipoprotein chaperone LolA [Candidatus Colwellia aromaticivorans]|uniref:outer membrane lipoprotein chaperone LolA n=1 Tax=Candidatus Colwellia aromaticivorans TaxID=2267621 RepID=UPI000DF131A2|nr:outer membrane lipoprotein chaperone LolA [Candidatus Colwellia aromaticivorans]
MNKAFFVNSTFVIALSFVTSSIMPVMAESQVSSPIKFEASKKLLRAKLADLKFFSANFTQEVVSETGELLEQSSGKLAISKPNLANWHTLEPDELAIVSDGRDVWFYNPWIEQVSVYSLSAAIAKTPILLLTSKDESLWQQYNVSKSDNSFVISAKDPNSQIKNLTLIFSVKKQKVQGSELSQFSFLDATGQVSHIKLSNFDAKNVPESSLFNFTVPEGVQIDDQRAN